MIRAKFWNLLKNISIAELAGSLRKNIHSAVSRFCRSRSGKIILAAAVSCAAAGILFFAVGNIAIASVDAVITDDTDEIAPHHAALVLGCSPHIGKNTNLFFRNRIYAAAELYHSGKVKKLILSGDNGRKGYNEPEAMRQALIGHGVPDKDIFCDYAGFSTLDSVIRAKEIFGQEEIIIVSQKFHCKRAIFLASAKGIKCSGFIAEDIGKLRWEIKNRFRESLARPAAILDLIFFRQPRFLGEKINMDIPQIKAD